MPPRMVDGPGRGKFVSGEKASDWLGVSEETLERLAANQPWMRPKKAGRKVVWEWFDIVCLGHLLDRMESLDTAPPAKKGE